MIRVATACIVTVVLLLSPVHLNAQPAARSATTTTSPAAEDEQQLREAAIQALERLAAGDPAVRHLILMRDGDDGEVESLDAMLEMMRAAERLRVAIATATNTRAENDAETAKMKARVRDSIAKGLVKIDGDEVTLTHAAPDTGEGAPGEQITMSARRVDGQWKLDVLRGVRSQEPAARAQTIHYMRMNAKAQDAVAAQFREGKVKNAAAVDYLVRMEMMRLEAEESVRKPAPATKAASRPIEKKAEVKRDERPPKAAASDPLGRGEIRRILTDGRVAAIALSPDGALLASGARLAEQPLRLWDVQTGELVRTFAMPAGLAVQVNDVMWTNDEKHVITCGRTFKDAERGARCRSRVARG